MASNKRDLFGHDMHTKPEIKGEEYAGIIINETQAAILFNDGERQVWLPKSKIHIDEEFGSGKKSLDRAATVTIPDWLAREKELI